MIDIAIDHIPKGIRNRPAIPMTPTFITVHSTGNPKSTARNERGWLTNPTNIDKKTGKHTQNGFHYVVDENEVVECIPPNEVAWHAGDDRGQGNMSSIGIEICESGDRKKTLENAIKLIQHLMKTHNIDKVVRHYDWSKKNCPRILNAQGDWREWQIFHNEVMQKPIDPYKEAVQDLVLAGIIGSPAVWMELERVHVNNVKSLVMKMARYIKQGV